MAPATQPDRGTQQETGGLERGRASLLQALTTLPQSPGVYRMVDSAGEVLYVGKARNLRRRVANYTQTARLPIRLQRMVARTAALEIVTTHTEVEALLLESNLIKRFAPRYNVLLRDDKSFPYILITGQIHNNLTRTGADPRAAKKARGGTLEAPRSAADSKKNTSADWPGLMKYRGARTAPGEYFGPFAAAGAVNRTLNTLERAFLLRSCTDSVFSNRSRPCLKYQLKRCSAPCVGHITEADYATLVGQARDFLSGRSREVQDALAEQMQQASENLAFEAAAGYRDRIRALTQVQSRQDINLENLDLPEADVIAAWQEGGQTCIQVFFFRNGRNYGNRAYFPRHDRTVETAEVLGAFVGQFYENKPPPRLVLVSNKLAEAGLIAEALSVRAGRKVTVSCPLRGARTKIVAHARDNARDALQRRLAENASNRVLLEGVAEAFGLDAPPARIEVYDNSHVMGRHAIGAMIVAGGDGFVKTAYRKFNIKGAADSDRDGFTPGDDYAMMREVLTRRFSRALKEDPDRNRGQWPDIVLIDGGQGQLSAVMAVMADLGIEDLPVVAIAKGPDRDAGRERFFMPGRAAFSLPLQDPVLYYLQRLRDEAHRFAIGTHRAKRAKAMHKNPLDEVPGIGTARKRALLTHFGSARAVARAGLADLSEVSGISATVAQRVYDHFHSDG